MKRTLMMVAVLVLAGGAFVAAAAAELSMPRGAELLMPFKKELQGALRDGLAQGPDAAIGVCKEKAPEIASRLSSEGIRMGRTSHKLRNPSNTAPRWVGPILKEYLSNPAARRPREIALPEGRYGYTEPILVQTVCLTCHGEKVETAIADRIAEHYPDDRAVGFKQGDFRGLFWVEYPTHK